MSVVETASGIEPHAGTDAQASWSDVPAALIGQAGAWFDLQREGDAVILRPNRPLPRRCTIRPAAMFRHARGFCDVNTVMGRIEFPNGATDPQCYTPFTHDPDRRPQELFLPVETMPDDDWPASPMRWTNNQAMARRLCAEASVPFSGLSSKDVDRLTRFVPWPEPLEGCLLHALVQWTHNLGCYVVEIGSFRGRSTSMLALALRGVGSDSLLMSVDPHSDEPLNRDHVRLALAQLGESDRLVQMPLRSDEAWRLLRPGAASMVFIDGNHSYDQVVADFTNYRDLLVPGGCMVFHDYGYGPHNGRPEADPDVRRAVDDHVFGCPGFKPVLLAHTQIAFVKQPEATR